MSDGARRAVGRILINPRGFGFLAVSAPDEEISAFVAPPELNKFLDGDLAEGQLTRAADGRWSATGLVLRERARTQLFGEVVTHGSALFVKVDREVANTDWPIDAAGAELRPGDSVVGRIDGAKLVLVRRLEPGADHSLERVVARYDIPVGVPAAAMEEVRAAQGRPHVLSGARRDLREVPTITVDAASTRDIDDAVSVLPADPDGGLRLLISIADVSEFIPAGGALDQSARDRGTSVYLANRVLPMLPEELSAEHLSLLPGQDRCCLTVELRLDPEGRVLAADVYESLIRSWARCTYVEVAAFLERGEISANLEPMRAALPWFRTASARLAVSRDQRGGVQIENDEARLTFDERGEVSGVVSEASTSAHQLIERFMVVANEAIASWLSDRGVPVPFRVQDRPDRERVDELAAFAENSGFHAGFGREVSPLALAAFDRQISGSSAEPALRAVLRRTLGFARYTASAGIHFGLAAERYLHFTSPIRRYADLAVHRAIKSYLRGRRDFVPADPAVESLCEWLNLRARAADRAERDRRRMLLARLMASRVGDTHSARITRVMPFGLLAQLDGMLVDGVVPTDALPGGPYRTDPRHTRLSDAHRTYGVGAPVVVKIAGADEQLGRVELELVSPR